jgi:hypothetical protein
LGPGGGAAGGGLAFDRRGNVAFYDYGGGGFGAGLSGVAGVSVQGSTAQTVNDLSGPFLTSSASLGAGPAGSIDAFVGSSVHGPVAGGGFTFGGGGGVSIFSGVTGTNVVSLFSAADVLKCRR